MITSQDKRENNERETTTKSGQRVLCREITERRVKRRRGGILRSNWYFGWKSAN
jgi:hypothetical protein